MHCGVNFRKAEGTDPGPVFPFWGFAQRHPSEHSARVAVRVVTESSTGVWWAVKLNAALVCCSFFVPCSATPLHQHDRCSAKPAECRQNPGLNCLTLAQDFLRIYKYIIIFLEKWVYGERSLRKEGVVVVCSSWDACTASVVGGMVGPVPWDGALGLCRSCWAAESHCTEPFSPGRWEQSTVGLLT